MREHVRLPQLTKKKPEWVAIVDALPRPFSPYYYEALRHQVGIE
jgi:hypothetical protein